MDQGITGPVIGVDEAGRGPVIGPMVVAAVRARDQEELRDLGVRDSKDLSPKRREELARQIRSVCTVETAIVPASEIDRLRNSITLNEIEVDVFCQVIRKHLLDLSPDEEMTIILDAADVKAIRFGFDIERKLLMRHGTVPRIVSEHKADDIYPVVSAASIIAKVIRDLEISLLKEKYGDLGSGYPADPITRKFLEEIIRSGKPIPQFIRTSWETVKKMKAASGTRKLEEYF